MTDRFHIVLVETQESLNIGSVARAMNNLGFRHLHLVTPYRYDRARARVMACGSEDRLDVLQIHDSLEEAVSGMEDVVGFSGRPGKMALSHFVTLPEWSQSLPERLVPRTALVFGREDDGLSQEHLDQCNWIVRIPTEALTSYNLAQSVLLVLYEITRSLPEGISRAVPVATEERATMNEYYQLDRLLNAVMMESGFVRKGTPEPVPGTVRHLFRRLPLNRQEMGILLSLFSRVNRALLHRRPNETEVSE